MSLWYLCNMWACVHLYSKVARSCEGWQRLRGIYRETPLQLWTQDMGKHISSSSLCFFFKLLFDRFSSISWFLPQFSSDFDKHLEYVKYFTTIFPFFNLPEKTHKSWVRMEDVFSSIFNKLSVFALKFTLTPSLLWKPTITLAWTIEEGRKKYRVSQKRWVLAALSSACEILILNFASWWSRRAAETWWGSQASAPLPFHVLASSSHRQRTSS